MILCLRGTVSLAVCRTRHNEALGNDPPRSQTSHFSTDAVTLNLPFSTGGNTQEKSHRTFCLSSVAFLTGARSSVERCRSTFISSQNGIQRSTLLFFPGNRPTHMSYNSNTIVLLPVRSLPLIFEVCCGKQEKNYVPSKFLFLKFGPLHHVSYIRRFGPLKTLPVGDFHAT
jgi:hypothetical protein